MRQTRPTTKVWSGKQLSMSLFQKDADEEAYLTIDFSKSIGSPYLVFSRRELNRILNLMDLIDENARSEILTLTKEVDG